MDTEKWNSQELPVACLENVLGDINTAEQEGPGIYYLSVSGSEEWHRGEYYALWADTPDISTEAKRYGLSAAQCPGLLLYPFAKEDSGWRIIQYELCKYRTVNKMPLPDENALTEAALYGTEIHPEYFGSYLVPPLTPWGHTLRYRVLDNGVYWLETNHCRYVLAVCFPIWQDLSNAAAEVGTQFKYAPEIHAESPMFFDERTYCIPVWELMQQRQSWESKFIEKAALMNAIWQYFPEYAAVYNTQVQQGLQDTVGLLLHTVDFPIDLEANIRDMIFLTPEAGIDFFRW